MNIFALSGLINGILSLTLGTLVYLRQRKNPVHQTFFLFNAVVAIWALSYWQWLNQETAEAALFWTRLLSVGSIFIPITFLHWVLTLLDKAKFKKHLLIFGYLVAAFFLLVSFSDHFVSSVGPAFGFPFWPKPGLFYHFFLFGSFLGFPTLAFIELFRSFRAATGQRRLQLKFVIIGTLIGFVGGSTNFPLWYGVHFPPIANILVSAYPIVFSYAIIKHRLLDIRLAVRALLVKFTLSVVIFFAAILIMKWIERYSIRFDGFYFYLIVFGIILFFTVFFEILDGFVRRLTDRFFFQREYSHQQMIRQLGRNITQSIEVKELLENIRKTLIEVMRLNYVGFVLFSKAEETANPPKAGRQIVIDGLTGCDTEWFANSFLLKRLREKNSVISLDDLILQSAEDQSRGDRELKEIINDFQMIKASVAIPLLNTEGLAGVIILGDKKGGNAFTSPDFDIFEMLMYQAGIGIENALLFAQTRYFNAQLSKEVTRATADLANKNRRLTVLRRLDMIIMNTLELTEMGQKIIDTVSWELGYEGGLIALLDEKGINLRAVAVSNTPALRRAVSSLPHGLRGLTLSVPENPKNPLVRAVNERRPIPAESFVDLYKPTLNEKTARLLEELSGIHHHVVYPLSAKGRILGVVTFGLSRPFPELAEEEKELLSVFMDEAGIAIENAILYSQTKKDKEELEKAYKKLKELDVMKDEFISITSHELRTPMSAIKGYLWMLANKGSNLMDNQKRYLEKAQKGSERMINLINDMLNVSRIEQGRIEMKIEPFNLPPLIKEVTEGFKIRASEAGLELKFIESSGLVTVLADADKVREIIGNLLENALKFTKEGLIKIEVSKVGRFVKVKVTDTGRGIARADIDKLFRKFGRLDHSFATVAESSGTGLGLYLSKLLVEKMGGMIGVTSKIGQGSTFYFTLPLETKRGKVTNGNLIDH